MTREAGLRVVEAACVEKVTLRARVEARCPVSGVVDTYELVLEYQPPGDGERCRYIEAYSLHEYLRSYQGRLILQEQLTAEVLRDTCRALGGGKVRVTTRGAHAAVEAEVTASQSCGMLLES